jgi:hypothetical protein
VGASLKGRYPDFQQESEVFRGSGEALAAQMGAVSSLEGRYCPWKVGSSLPGIPVGLSHDSIDRPARVGRAGRAVSRTGCLGSDRGPPQGRSAARRRAGDGSSGRDRRGAARGTRPRAGWAGLSGRGRSRPGEPVGRRDLLGRPLHDLRGQPLLLAEAEARSLGVRDLLAGPAQELPPIPGRVLVGLLLLGRRLPGIAPIRPVRRPGRGSPFRVERLLDELARVVARRFARPCILQDTVAGSTSGLIPGRQGSRSRAPPR